MVYNGRVLVYSIVGCPHCKNAKASLTERGIPYTDVSLDMYPESVREDVMKRTGKTTVPQIFFNAIYIGGNEELQKFIADKKRFQELLQEVVNNEPPADAPQPPDEATMLSSSAEIDLTCERDEYAQLVYELRLSGLITDRRKGLHTYKHTFVGKEFVDWVVKTKGVDRAKAVEMGQTLLEQKFGHKIKGKSEHFQDDENLYRLIENDESMALNSGLPSDCPPRPAGEIGEILRRLILNIFNEFLSEDGKSVDYKGIEASDGFKSYVKATSELIRVDIESASREEKLAFFTNIYNALVIHANVVKGPPVSLWQRYKFFNTVSYIIGSHLYSLQDIENGVLRSNRKGVGMFFRPFGKDDPRLKVALKNPEPLIHFALVCGAKSCPPIKTYTTDGVDGQLSLAANAFLESDDGCQVDVNHKELKLSRIFCWYREDFGKNNEEIASWVLNHLPEGKKKQQLADLIEGKNVKIGFLKYDWSANSKK
ncbi:uncharacterized protein [Antedon mediterranea]|uniref:uncharacterized protein n=1 Tax=Antedon mediterranea TaxID=105859 RepID=UPI003AF61B0A